MTNDVSLQIWEFFLASSTITSRQGGATCYQITLVKNINSTHRINGINSQFNLSGALASAKAKGITGLFKKPVNGKA